MAELDKQEGPHLESLEGDCDVNARWNSLPDVLVIYIYEYLCDYARLQMACACKRWRDLFYTPSLWRRRRVHFIGLKAENKARRECQYIKIMGRYLKTLTVSFGKPTYRTVKVMALAAETYLKQLLYDSKLRLTGFVLHHLALEHCWHFWISRNKVIGTLCRLFRRLRYLETVTVVSCRLSLLEGCRLLESLGRGYAANTLKVLSADDLFQTNIIPVRHKRYVHVMSKFSGLTQIYVNYGSINAGILDSFAENLSNTLQKLTLSIEKNVSNFIIPSEVWKNFSKHCRHAVVTLYIYVTGRLYDPTQPLVKGVPVAEVNAVSWASIAQHDHMQGQIPLLIRHVGRTYSDTLEHLTLQLDQNPPIDEDLLYLLNTCRKLRHLQLCCCLAVTTVDKIRLLLVQNVIHLQSLTLNIHGLNEREWHQLRTIQQSLIDAINGRS
ncbi:F-box only protein 39-like [Mizuhopecten yessoensis]|uniref:F-box only protein 39 n=1 Tax=Mizuhopecten yessoensis TaxID=6573 RepID=A0A210R2I8_MIZYE|nr:F-box only protein 39-like [Mizuhopecten yessoensis]OWF55121.1 F-box only protein 39 [Mizuhopecten yessoensis]